MLLRLYRVPSFLRCKTILVVLFLRFLISSTRLGVFILLVDTHLLVLAQIHLGILAQLPSIQRMCMSETLA